MNFSQEFEFIFRETTDVDASETIKRFTTSEGERYSDVVNVFLDFLSSAYGYHITLDMLLDKDESSSY